jgi:capsular polysaccharide export protein
MLAGAAALICDPADPVRAIAAVLGVPAYTPAGGELRVMDDDLGTLLAPALAWRFADPFGAGEISAREAIELSGHWRQLIDANRSVGAALGFAFWKQETVGALLWGGSAPVPFMRSLPESLGGKAVALWRSKAPAAALAGVEQTGSSVLEVEDGFLRSQGLGADCVPPLSITVDRLGAYFDPGQPSELEQLLQSGAFGSALLDRARQLREVIVAAGLGKYEQGHAEMHRPAGERRHILVPGQVEDDRSVQTGGCGLHSNLELLRRVRTAAPDAYLIYKPHPDVLAGHRKGAVPETEARVLADEIAQDTPISSLLNMVDEVHVNTSLAGFEALMRGKSVTTHGVPFYAGWGLTTDLGPVPERRTARRSLDELVAATLLLYPRYLDPVSGLPCPVEVVVRRLTSGEARQEGALVWLRRLQGKVVVRLKAFLS